MLEYGTTSAINETISTQADVRMKKLIQTRVFSGLGAIDLYDPKSKTTRVIHTYVNKQDTYG